MKYSWFDLILYIIAIAILIPLASTYVAWLMRQIETITW
jgi:hypothetical protein